MKSKRLDSQSGSGMNKLLGFQSSEKFAIQNHGMSCVHTFDVTTYPSALKIKEKKYESA
jgi:hypothetical protein